MTIACPDCGTLEEIPFLAAGSRAICTRCDNILEKTSGRSITAALACAFSTFLLLFPANLMPLLHMDVLMMSGENVIGGGIRLLFRGGWALLAGISAVLVVILPFFRFGLLSAVLGAIRLGYRPRWLGRAFRWAMWLDPWAMIDVYLLAALIGYFRLINIHQAHVVIGAGGACFVAAAFLTLLSRATLDARAVWRRIGPEAEVPRGIDTVACTTCDIVQPAEADGAPCPRCGAKLMFRRPYAMERTIALLIAAFILFFPANLLPMNISSQLGRHVDYTIFRGVSDLFSSHLWFLGIIIFCTSIVIPMGKIVAVGWCVLSVRQRSRRHLEAKVKLFRFVAELGRWSKTDPFVIVFFTPLVNFGALASENAGWGAVAFMMMSIFTMVASFTFDPRLMFDAAEGRI